MTTIDRNTDNLVAELEGVGCRYEVWMTSDGTCTALVEGYGPVDKLPPARPVDGAIATTFAAAIAAVVNAIEADCCSDTRLDVRN